MPRISQGIGSLRLVIRPETRPGMKVNKNPRLSVGPEVRPPVETEVQDWLLQHTGVPLWTQCRAPMFPQTPSLVEQDALAEDRDITQT